MTTSPGPAPFIVQVAALRKLAGSVRHEVREGSIEGLSAIGVSVPDGGPVVCDLTLASYPGGIMVTGTVRPPGTANAVAAGDRCRARWRPTCASATPLGRTGSRTRTPICSRGTSWTSSRWPGRGHAGPPPGPPVLARLSRPLPPLGQNWNIAACACPPDGDPRWSGLDALRGPEAGGLA